MAIFENKNRGRLIRDINWLAQRGWGRLRDRFLSGCHNPFSAATTIENRWPGRIFVIRIGHVCGGLLNDDHRGISRRVVRVYRRITSAEMVVKDRRVLAHMIETSVEAASPEIYAVAKTVRSEGSDASRDAGSRIEVTPKTDGRYGSRYAVDLPRAKAHKK